MPIWLRIIFTVVGLIAMAVTMRMDPERRLAPPDRFWRWGARDPVKRLLFRDDGRMKPSTKLVLLAAQLLGIVVVWILPYPL